VIEEIEARVMADGHRELPPFEAETDARPTAPLHPDFGRAHAAESTIPAARRSAWC
jgi:hypothetical protein